MRRTGWQFFNPKCVFDAHTQTAYVVNALAVLISGSIRDYYRKKAALMILQYFIPHWRELFGDEIYPFSRHDPRVTEWRKAVLQRDGYQCRICESTRDLEAHHIIPWSEYPPGRVDVNNGLTLCNFCHSEMHVHERKLILYRSGKVGAV